MLDLWDGLKLCDLFFYELGAGWQPAGGTNPYNSPVKVWSQGVNHLLKRKKKKGRSVVTGFEWILAHCCFCFCGSAISPVLL